MGKENQTNESRTSWDFWNAKVRVPGTNLNLSLSNIPGNAKYLTVGAITMFGLLSAVAAQNPEGCEVVCAMCVRFGDVPKDAKWTNFPIEINGLGKCDCPVPRGETFEVRNLEGVVIMPGMTIY